MTSLTAPDHVDLAQRNSEHESEVWLLVNEADAAALVDGIVTERLRELARCAQDWHFRAQLAANIAKPVRTRKRT